MKQESLPMATNASLLVFTVWGVDQKFKVWIKLCNAHLNLLEDRESDTRGGGNTWNWTKLSGKLECLENSRIFVEIGSHMSVLLETSS